MMKTYKKGQGFQVYSIVWLVKTVFLFLIMIYILQACKSETFDLNPQIRYEVLVSRFIADPDCLAMYDEASDKKMLNTIDFAKFNDAHLDKCYHVKDTSSTPVFKIELFYEEDNKEVTKEFTTSHWFGKKVDRSITKQVKMVKESKIIPAKLVFSAKNVP